MSMLRKIASFDEHFSTWIYEKIWKYNSWNLPLAIICFMLQIMGHGVPWIAYAFHEYLFTMEHPKNEFVRHLLAALLIDALLIAVIKLCFRRLRPCVHTNRVARSFWQNLNPDTYSFPSGHSSRAVMLYLVLTRSVNAPFQVMDLSLAGWAAAICISRVVFLRHYVSDVIGGICLGVVEWLMLEKYGYLDNILVMGLNMVDENVIQLHQVRSLVDRFLWEQKV